MLMTKDKDSNNLISAATYEQSQRSLSQLHVVLSCRAQSCDAFGSHTVQRTIYMGDSTEFYLHVVTSMYNITR